LTIGRQKQYKILDFERQVEVKVERRGTVLFRQPSLPQASPTIRSTVERFGPT